MTVNNKKSRDTGTIWQTTHRRTTIKAKEQHSKQKGQSIKNNAETSVFCIVFLFCLSSFRLVPNVSCISGFSIIDFPFCLLCCSFALIVVLLCVVCPMLPVSLDCLLLTVPSVCCVVPLLSLSSFCVLCAQCCLYLWILYY
jgi:hypothetical protein